MATRLKPSRINVDNTPRVGDGASYQNDNDFHWSEGGGDMSYEDFEWVTLTGNSLVIENISNNVTPTGNFTVSAGTLRPGIQYILRVNTGNTAYTMTLGTGVTNPNGYSTELTPNKVNQFKFIATSDSQLELEGVDTSDFVTLGTQQTITAKKTFDVEPELGTAKTTDATNDGTKFATEAQVYKKLDSLTILSYGNSTWNDFITAYNKNAVIYCRASSNSNPATGNQGRMAFMAYVSLSGTTPTSVEFQYYRSRSDHKSAANQLDQVFVYTLASNGAWSVTERNTATKLLAGTGLSLTYDNDGNMTMDNTGVISVNGNTGTITVNDIKQSATAPANPTAGTAWYDTTNGALKVYNGSAWDTIATGGAISDTAYGPGWDGQTTTAPSQNAVYDKISSIDALIPSEATSSNKLADKAFVGDSINSVTAYYITKNANGDQFATYAELAAATTFYSGGVVRVPTKNDYTIVLSDENHDNATTRYIYNNGWEYQYTINETPLTQAQLDALNSGITAGKVSTYDGYATSKQDKLVNQTNIKSINNNSLLGSGNLTLNDVKVSATAPSSPTEGMLWYDTTNDQLKVYDGTNWNVTGKEYNAGPGISIGAIQDYSAMQGPCDEGFHIPTHTEIASLITKGVSLGAWSSSDGTGFINYLKAPKGGFRRNTDASLTNQDSRGYFWCCDANSTNGYFINFSATSVSDTLGNARSMGFSIRPFKDRPVIPDNSWTTLYDGSSVASGAGIFHNVSEGIISISDDGVNWITIADKNCGATTVYNDGDTLSEANCGKYYQWGNNYGFPRTGTVTTSSTQINAQNYGPGNYYSSSTWITVSADWSSVQNDNLWGGTTGVVTIDNAISNTGVLSVNGQTGNIMMGVPTLIGNYSYTAASFNLSGYNWIYITISDYSPVIIYKDSFVLDGSNHSLRTPTTTSTTQGVTYSGTSLSSLSIRSSGSGVTGSIYGF